ncbi:MAG: purine-binding chemotaxis protein CheW [Nitrospirales bacterium]|nr:MAG: purine-binding chemotaxis protein CheW [Nitrospirales bacterium]
MPAVRQFCTFTIDTLLLGVNVRVVQAVLRDQRMTYVPLASPVIRGLMNVRGHVVTTLDLRRRLGMKPALFGSSPMHVVIRTDHEPVSLLVDELGDVIDVADNACESLPSSLDSEARALLSGAYTCGDRMLLVLDLGKVMAVSHENHAQYQTVLL